MTLVLGHASSPGLHILWMGFSLLAWPSRLLGPGALTAHIQQYSFMHACKGSLESRRDKPKKQKKKLMNINRACINKRLPLNEARVTLTRYEEMVDGCQTRQ